MTTNPDRAPTHTDAQNAQDAQPEAVEAPVDEAAGPSPSDTDADWLGLSDDALELNSGEKLVYAAVTELRECAGVTLVDELGLSPGTVYPALHELEDRGLVKRRPKLLGHVSYFYRIADANIEPPSLDTDADTDTAPDGAESSAQ